MTLTDALITLVVVTGYVLACGFFVVLAQAGAMSVGRRLDLLGDVVDLDAEREARRATGPDVAA